jgi:hypothetical protein
MNLSLYTVILLIFISVISNGQEEQKNKFSEAIEDNSFLIEEAYNQEPRVVQHISNLEYFPDTHSYYYTFTQEWPISGFKHQFSYTIPFSFLNSNQYNGIGDIILNYRYQLFYEEDWACVSPRISLIVPTGNKDKGLGNGVWGVQISLPASKRISEYFAAHFNLGSTFLNYVKASDERTNQTFKKNIFNFYTGLSIIYLTSKNINFMLESLTYFNGNIQDGGNVKYINQTIINPGIRYAINLNKLQIVPGISVSLTFQHSQKMQTPLFLYLSFEHPY